jgi:antitoxin VapB
MTRTARLFQSGGSQAVRLPADFRFTGDLVYVRRDERTGDVILSSRPAGRWSDFVAARQRLGVAPDDFLVERDQPTDHRDPFGEV